MVQLNPFKWGNKKKNKLKAEKKMGGQGGSKTRYQTKRAKPVIEKRTDTGVKGGQGGSKSRYSKGTTAPTVNTSKTTSKSKGKGKGSGVTINGKPPTSTQKKLLAGGWSAKELEAKINARKKKK